MPYLILLFFIPQASRAALLLRLSSVKTDVAGAPLRLCLAALQANKKPPRPHYAVHYGGGECMYVVPQVGSAAPALSPPREIAYPFNVVPTSMRPPPPA
jgi:hypothetical protein